MVTGGVAKHIRSNTGAELLANVVSDQPAKWDARTLCTQTGSPCEKDYLESFNGKLRDESLDGAVVNCMNQAKVLIESWRGHDNTMRPHASLRHRPPAPEALAAGPTSSSLQSDHSSGYLQ